LFQTLCTNKAWLAKTVHKPSVGSGDFLRHGLTFEGSTKVKGGGGDSLAIKRNPTMIGNGRLPQHRHGAARSGALLIASSWISLIVIVSLYLALKPAAVERSDLIQEDASMMSPFARMTSLRQCVCPDTPLSEIDEPNVGFRLLSPPSTHPSLLLLPLAYLPFSVSRRFVLSSWEPGGVYLPPPSYHQSLPAGT
jgi:hypothetical protein